MHQVCSDCQNEMHRLFKQKQTNECIPRILHNGDTKSLDVYG